MGFQLRTPGGTVLVDVDIDHRLVKSVSIGASTASVPFNADFLEVNLDFRSASDLELLASGEVDAGDAEKDIAEVREDFGLAAPASKTEAEVEEELKERVGMKVVEPKAPKKRKSRISKAA